MDQELNNTFEYINNDEDKVTENTPTDEEKIINNEENLTQDFVTGLPSWDLEPPYEVIRRVTR